MIFLAFCVGFILCALLVLFIVLVIPARPRPAPPTMHRRKNRDAPERKLFEELKSGVQELEAGRNGGIDYKWLGITGEER